MMTISKTVANTGADPIEVIFEPWAVSHMLPAGQSFSVEAQSDIAGELEIRHSNAGIEVFAWQGATLQVWNGSTVVNHLDTPVPALPPGMSAKQFIDLLFGRKKQSS